MIRDKNFHDIKNGNEQFDAKILLPFVSKAYATKQCLNYLIVLHTLTLTEKYKVNWFYYCIVSSN